MNYYDILNIISYFDIDTKILMRRMNKFFNKEIGKIKIWNYKKLINLGDKYDEFIGLRIGSFRISKQGNKEYLYGLIKSQFRDACYYGDLDIVRLLIEKGANEWNYGLYGACHGGNLDMVNLMIEKGANNLNSGLCGACDGGNLDIVKLMIEKGANDWNLGLCGACYGGNLDIVKLMIEKGATECGNCYKSMQEHLNKKMINK